MGGALQSMGGLCFFLSEKFLVSTLNFVVFPETGLFRSMTVSEGSLQMCAVKTKWGGSERRVTRLKRAETSMEVRPPWNKASHHPKSSCALLLNEASQAEGDKTRHQECSLKRGHDKGAWLPSLLLEARAEFCSSLEVSEALLKGTSKCLWRGGISAHISTAVWVTCAQQEEPEEHPVVYSKDTMK